MVNSKLCARAVMVLVSVQVAFAPFGVVGRGGLAIGSAYAASSAELLLGARLSTKLARENLVRQAAMVLATEASSDTDGYPLAPLPTAATSVVGGGVIPASSGAPKGDGQGGLFGYCAWDTGSINTASGYLAGGANFGSVSLAVVSAGFDGVFQVSCADIASGAATLAGSDDYVVAYRAGQIMSGVQGANMVGSSVASQSSLSGLAAPYDGQVRLVKDQGVFYRYSSATGQWSEVIKRTGVTAGTYGSSSQTPVITVDANGRVTALSTVAGGGGVTSINGQTGAVSLAVVTSVNGQTGSVIAVNTFNSRSGNITLTQNDIWTAQGYKSASENATITAGQGLWSVGSLSNGVVIGLSPTSVMPGVYGGRSTDPYTGRPIIKLPALSIDGYGRVVSAMSQELTSTDIYSALGMKPVNSAGDAMGQLSIGYGFLPLGAALPPSVHDLMVKGSASINGLVIGSGLAPYESEWSDRGNVVLGPNLGQINGYNNSFVGKNAGGYGAGDDNSVMGFRALRNISNGGRNSAFGARALTSLVSGMRNVAIGSDSAVQMQSGYANVAIGDRALSGLLSGDSNLVIGSFEQGGVISGAGDFLVSGSGNTIIGVSSSGVGSFAQGVSSLDKTLLLGVGGVERLRSDSFGLWRFSTNNTSTSGSTYVYTFCATSACSVGASGSAVGIGGDAKMYANGYVTASDGRFKSGVVSLDVASGQLDRFMAVRPVGYTLNASGQYSTGYIAQELQQLFPHMVMRYDEQGHLGVDYTQMIPVIHAVVQAQQRQIEGIKSRVQFEDDGATVLTGRGLVAVEVRSEVGDRLASFNDLGLALPGHVQLEGVDSSIRFDGIGIAVRGDGATGALVIDGRADSGGVRLGLRSRTLDDVTRVMGYLFGDERGVGLSDGEGKALLSALTRDGVSTVSVNADLVVGDGRHSRIAMAGGASIVSSDEGFLDLQAQRGVRIFDPVTQKAVITLGADGVLEAKAIKTGRVSLTEVVDPDASCEGSEGALARDGLGGLLVCVR